ncbi:class I SAM-dependent methyltransferase [bacterium]|nr:class I SAM-dependent methyltransferase [bacterium]
MIVANPDARTDEQIREQYEVERDLAGRLRAASREDRKRLYTELYEELFRRIPHHPLLTQSETPDEKRAIIDRQLRWLRPLVHPDATFLEVGAGECLVTFEVAKLVRKAIAIEVSETVVGHGNPPDNFELIISDGTSIPVPPGSVDVVYSQQLMEHLHPDDALEQLRNIYDALKPGGRYFCVTPNRTTGPHDISRFFEERAAGFHLKEYTIGELDHLFRDVGFRDVGLFVSTGANPRSIPTWPFRAAEGMLSPLPRGARIRIARKVKPGVLFSFRLVATK